MKKKLIVSLSVLSLLRYYYFGWNSPKDLTTIQVLFVYIALGLGGGYIMASGGKKEGQGARGRPEDLRQMDVPG